MALCKISLAEQARDALLQAIVTGKLAAGTRLTEEALCAEFAISRTPVRAALSRLEADGLVERLPARGYRVVHLDPAAVEELLAARRELEMMILERWFGRLDRAALKNLRDELAAADPGAQDALETARTCDDRLHALIGAACANRFLREIHAGLLRRRLPYRDFRNSPGAVSAAELKAERLALLVALLSGERGRSLALLGEHLERGRAAVLNALAEQEARRETSVK